MTDLRDIATSWLSLHGYGGLYNDRECACEKTNLMPCDEPSIDCTPGYKVVCPEGHEYNFMITHNKTDKCEDDAC